MSSDKTIEETQIAIVGAGPAGTTLARLLAAAGRDVLLLEAKTLPRHKTCAGGLPPRAVQALGVDISSVVRGHIKEVALDGAWNGRHLVDLAAMVPATAAADAYGALVVERAELDELLAKAAVAAGARLRQKCRCQQVKRTGNGFILHTTHGNIHAETVCGCDGARSVVGRNLGFTANNCGLCLETLIPLASGADARACNRAVLDITAVRSGYAWAFPRRDGFSVGVGAILAPGLKQKLQQILNDFITRTPELDATSIAAARVYGCLIPGFSSAKPFYARNGAYLAGDAAGLVDPLTGEGIYHAARSAAHAAAAIMTNNEELYHERLAADMFHELRITAKFSRRLSLTPQWLIRALLSNRKFRGQTDGLLRILAGSRISL